VFIVAPARVRVASEKTAAAVVRVLASITSVVGGCGFVWCKWAYGKKETGDQN
jgi:hypothetical protein